MTMQETLHALEEVKQAINLAYASGYSAGKQQREWQGLTDKELQFYRKKYSKLVNVGYYKKTHTNVVTEEFDSTGFYKEISTVLKEKNT